MGGEVNSYKHGYYGISVPPLLNDRVWYNYAYLIIPNAVYSFEKKIIDNIYFPYVNRKNMRYSAGCNYCIE